MNNMSNVQILVGAEGIKKAYESSLNSKKLDIICLSTNYEKVLGDYFDNQYAPKMYDGSIQTREILPNDPANREPAGDKDQQQNQVKFMDTKPSQSDMIVCDDQVIVISYNEESPFALLIADIELVNGFRTQFEGLWKSL